MRARMMVERPDDIEMTLKLTMPMSDWDKLRDQLNQSYPGWRLSAAINQMMASARKVHRADEVDCFDECSTGEPK